jgi:hypothetical protein
MKKYALIPIVLATAFATNAQAAINLVLDQQVQSVNAQATPFDVTWTGSVTLTNGWEVDSVSSSLFSIVFDSAFVAYATSHTTGNYSGNLFSVTVNPGDSGSDIETISVTGHNPLNNRSFTDHEAFELDVNPVPEPTTMVALGLGAAAMLRRRKK